MVRPRSMVVTLKPAWSSCGGKSVVVARYHVGMRSATTSAAPVTRMTFQMRKRRQRRKRSRSFLRSQSGSVAIAEIVDQENDGRRLPRHQHDVLEHRPGGDVLLLGHPDEIAGLHPLHVPGEDRVAAPGAR